MAPGRVGTTVISSVVNRLLTVLDLRGLVSAATDLLTGESSSVDAEYSRCRECGATFVDAFECPDCGSRSLTTEVVVDAERTTE